METFKPITHTDIEGYTARFDENPVWKAAALNLSKALLCESVFDPIKAGYLHNTFSHEIKTMPVTNQNASGRCWLFAGLNLLREVAAKKLNVESFELSQNYLAFYDKLEKANYMLESVIATADRDIDDRTVCWILSSGLQDGGQWDMFASLIEKYGVVPKFAMQETFQSGNTGCMNSVAGMLLRDYCRKLRDMAAASAPSEAVREEKGRMMGEFYGFLAMCFGRPPVSFDFEYKDKAGGYFVNRGMTPKSFYDEYIGLSMDDYISLINAPTADKPMNRAYTVKFLGNVAGGREILYVNVEMDRLIEAAAAQIKGGEPVWFGSDVTGKFGSRKPGLWDTGCFDYETALGIKFGMDKTTQLEYRDSCMTHAMLLTGMNIVDGKPNRWKIENSWGEENGEKGYYVGGEGWFERYVYQAVIHKKYLSKDILEMAKQTPIELNPWDPMGSLAY